MNQEKIGSFISTLRKEKQLTQEQLGEKLGVSQKSISRWETGKNMPDIAGSVQNRIKWNYSIRLLRLFRLEKTKAYSCGIPAINRKINAAIH